jgi:hypothetical protein
MTEIDRILTREQAELSAVIAIQSRLEPPTHLRARSIFLL